MHPQNAATDIQIANFWTYQEDKGKIQKLYLYDLKEKGISIYLNPAPILLNKMTVNIYVLDTSAFARTFISHDTSLLEAQKYFLKQKIRDTIMNDHSNNYGALIYFNQNPEVGMPLTNVRGQLDTSVSLAKFCDQATIVNRTLSTPNFLSTLSYATLAIEQRIVKNAVLKIIFLIASIVSFDETVRAELVALNEAGIKLTVIFAGKYAARCHEEFMKHFPEGIGEVHLCLNEISDGTKVQNMDNFGDEDDYELQQILQLSAQEYQREQEKRRQEAQNAINDTGNNENNTGDDFAGFM